MSPVSSSVPVDQAASQAVQFAGSGLASLDLPVAHVATIVTYTDGQTAMGVGTPSGEVETDEILDALLTHIKIYAERAGIDLRVLLAKGGQG